MGVENEKSKLFRRMIEAMEKKDLRREDFIALTDEELRQVEEMARRINVAVCEALSQQSYVSSNVLMYSVAFVVCSVLKLDYTMWKSDSYTYLTLLVDRLWPVFRSDKANDKP